MRPIMSLQEFWIGMDEYLQGRLRTGAHEFQGVGAQAYDRGAELAIRRMAEHRAMRVD